MTPVMNPIPLHVALLGHVEAMRKFANKLEASMPIFEQDIADVRECIDACRQQALRLRVSQAVEIRKTVQISAAMDDLEGRKAA